MQQTIAYLKEKFETGDVPTQQDFWDFLESFIHFSQLVQTTGASVSDVMSQKAVTDAISAAVGAFVQHYKGTYLTSGALTAAHPTAVPGDYAYVDAGVGQPATSWIWDNDDAIWRQGGITSIAWGTIIGTMSAQTDLIAALNLKSNAIFTITSKTGSYTMAAAEVTVLDAGGSLIIASTTGDLTLPNALIGTGKSFAVRGFANMVNGGSMVITGTNGTLAIPTGKTCLVEITGATTAILHNGVAMVTTWSTNELGISEESTPTEAEAIPTGAQASTMVGLSQSRALSEIGVYYMLRKFVTLAWTWAVGPIISDATASTPAWFNASKKLVTAVSSDFLNWLGTITTNTFTSLTSVTNATTWTIPAGEWYSRRKITLTENSTITLSGASNGYQGELWVTASGADRTLSIPAGASHKMMGVGDNTVKTIIVPSGKTFVVWWEYNGADTVYRWGYIDE